MNKATLMVLGIIIAAALVIAGVGYVAWVSFFTPASSNISAPFGELPPQHGGSTPGGAVGGSPQPVPPQGLDVQTNNGTILVSDFTKDADVASPSDGSYFMVSSTHSATATTTAPDYQIFYFPSDKSVLVSILTEPIGAVRKRATEDLESRFNISASDVCTLLAEVTIPRSLNTPYAGKSLGFPGCPGSVVLPEN